MASDLRAPLSCAPPPNSLESENIHLQPTDRSTVPARELPEFPSTQLSSFQYGNNSCARQELQRLYEFFHSWLQPERHSKDQIISQLVVEQFMLSGFCRDKSMLREKWESSGRNLKKLLEGMTDDCMKPPVLVRVYMHGQEALFSENMPLREVIDHLKKHLSSETTTGQNMEMPFQPSQGASLEMIQGGEGKDGGYGRFLETTSVNDSITNQENNRSSLLIIQEKVNTVPDEGSASLENPNNFVRAETDTSRSQEGSPERPSHQQVPLEVQPAFPTRTDQPSFDPVVTHQSNERNSTGKGHEERVDKAPKSYKCEKCPKIFRYLCKLLAHERRHKNERPFACAECHKSFFQASDLRVHQMIHTRERPFVCSVCGKAFNHKTNLRAHERIHTGEKPYTCSLCQRSYRQSSTYHRHLRTYHKLGL
ncbi:zinc finger and SCAN domain-containing protein 4 [Ctenodactylus gundi]